MRAPSVERTIKKPKSKTLRFGPADHGRPVTERQLDTAEYVGEFKYEIIDGRLYVSPQPNAPEHDLECWLRDALIMFALSHPNVINHVATKGRVFLPVSTRRTVPEPDLAAYHGYPKDQPIRQRRWQKVSPVLVCEVLVDGDFQKDLGRNPDLYLRVPSIQEYWVVNGAENPDEPSLIQYVRRGKKWSMTIHPFGSKFTPKVLPGFSLIIDPRRS
jgi:Uma2 family endonuclease